MTFRSVRAAARPQPPGGRRQTLQVSIGKQALAGELTLVPQARGLVVFAHGSGSSFQSPRDRFVADVLHDYRLDTLLFDLLTAAEGQERERVFDIDLLGHRLGEALDWARAQEGIGALCTGLFGASTGAAAALLAAAQYPGLVTAVVSRGGRSDLATPWLARVQAPTLLIVGGRDAEVLRLNRDAVASLRCEWRLEVVPGATHLFEEPGEIETVAHLASNWFADRLRLPVR
jgi:putative phosphoribosyl transferase